MNQSLRLILTGLLLLGALGSPAYGQICSNTNSGGWSTEIQLANTVAIRNHFYELVANGQAAAAHLYNDNRVAGEFGILHNSKGQIPFTFAKQGPNGQDIKLRIDHAYRFGLSHQGTLKVFARAKEGPSHKAIILVAAVKPVYDSTGRITAANQWYESLPPSVASEDYPEAYFAGYSPKIFAHWLSPNTLVTRTFVGIDAIGTTASYLDVYSYAAGAWQHTHGERLNNTHGADWDLRIIDANRFLVTPHATASATATAEPILVYAVAQGLVTSHEIAGAAALRNARISPAGGDKLLVVTADPQQPDETLAVYDLATETLTNITQASALVDEASLLDLGAGARFTFTSIAASGKYIAVMGTKRYGLPILGATRTVQAIFALQGTALVKVGGSTHDQVSPPALIVTEQRFAANDRVVVWNGSDVALKTITSRGLVSDSCVALKAGLTKPEARVLGHFAVSRMINFGNAKPGHNNSLYTFTTIQ